MFRVNTSRTLVKSLALDARLQGKSTTDFAGDCERPVMLHMFGYPDKLLVAHEIEPDRAVAQVLEARCRKCDCCLKHRARLWSARAIDETASSVRTWFGTLTLAPEHAFRLRLLAERRVQTRHLVEWNDLEPSEQFQAICEQAGPELTKWLKRVRKQSGAKFRYLLVTEAHKTGIPHWHFLMHEHEGTVPARVISDQWLLGFSQRRLVPPDDSRAAAYACKYLAKSALTRVRASAAYGRAGPRLMTERLLRSDAASVTQETSPVMNEGPPRAAQRIRL